MEQKCNVKILSTKRLTKSFQQNEHGTWESIGLTHQEAIKVVSNAVKKLKTDAEPLTMTITVNV
jgi:hypothetical protein